MGLFDYLIDKAHTTNYKDLTNKNPTKPFVIWGNVDEALENYYKLPHINLTDSKQDLDTKNTMRHIVGSAVARQEYKPLGAQIVLGTKEAGDFLREALGLGYKPKFGEKYYMDGLIDKENNAIGTRFGENNPNASLMEIMDFAYNHANDKTKVNPYAPFNFEQLKNN